MNIFNSYGSKLHRVTSTQLNDRLTLERLTGSDGYIRYFAPNHLILCIQLLHVDKSHIAQLSPQPTKKPPSDTHNVNLQHLQVSAARDRTDDRLEGKTGETCWGPVR